MKLWIGLSILVIALVAVSSLDWNTQPLAAAPNPPPPTAAVIHQPKAARYLTKHKAQKPSRHVVAKHVESGGQQPVETQATAAQAADYPKWDGTKKPLHDPIMELRSTETVRPDDGPALTITYGDLPAPNFKVEHRSTTRSKPTSGFIATGD